MDIFIVVFFYSQFTNPSDFATLKTVPIRLNIWITEIITFSVLLLTSRLTPVHVVCLIAESVLNFMLLSSIGWMVVHNLALRSIVKHTVASRTLCSTQIRYCCIGWGRFYEEMSLPYSS